MSIKHKNKPLKNIEVTDAVEVKETTKHWQSFKVLKAFPTMDSDGNSKTYQVGEKFSHYDKRVINFLKQQKII